MASEWIFKKGDRRLELAAQEQALRINSIKHSVDKTSQTPLCRLCGTLSVDVRSLPRQGGPAGTLRDV